MEPSQTSLEESRHKRLLVVEDDLDTAELLSQQLERDDLSVEIARNGQEAILIVGENPPDLILMDLMMPKLDGYETTRYFKAKFRGKFVPILVLTAKGDASSRAKGARFGCEEYLTKPYARKELIATVDALLAIGWGENALHIAATPTPRPEAPEPVEGEEPEEGAPDPEPFDLDAAMAQWEASEARRKASAPALRERVSSLRVEMAERQIAGGRPEVARIHLERAVELGGGDRASQLLAQLGQA